MEISGLKSAATLLIRNYNINNYEDFKINYCAWGYKTVGG